MIALISGLTCSARAIAASTSSAGLASPELTSSACAVASIRARSSLKVRSSSSVGRGPSDPMERTSSSVSSPTVSGSGSAPTRRQASTTPGMNELRSIESWRIVSVWPSPPKTTSWWATRPGSRIEWIGSWTLAPAAREQLGGAGGGSRRLVELAVVVELDDLDLGHVLGDPLAELHHQHGADREVRGDEGAGTLAPVPVSVGALAQLLEVEAGRADDDADAGVQALDGRCGSAVSGTVKSTTTSASPRTSAELGAERGVGAAAELEAVGRLDGRRRPSRPCARRRRRLRLGSGRSSAQVAQGASLTGATALRKQPSSAPMQAAEMRSGA